MWNFPASDPGLGHFVPVTSGSRKKTEATNRSIRIKRTERFAQVKIPARFFAEKPPPSFKVKTVPRRPGEPGGAAVTNLT
jgi:hypothetical protein